MIRLTLRDATSESDILANAQIDKGLDGFKLWLARNFCMTPQERANVCIFLERDGIVECTAPSKTGTRKYELTAMIEED